MKSSTFKIIIVLVLTLTIGISAQLLATSQGDTQKKGGTLTVPYLSESVPVMDPHKTGTQGGQTYQYMVCEPLVRMEDGKIAGVLAKDWESSNQGKTWTLHLREGVKFHNGEELSAEDVKKNVKRISDPENSLPGVGTFANVESVEVIDNLTIRFNLKKSNPDFIAKLLSTGYCPICEPSSWKDRKEGEPMAGTGPFMYVPEEYSQASKMVLQKFTDYWRGEPYLDRVEVLVSPSTEASLMQLEKGTFDFVQFVNPSGVKRLQEKGFKAYPFGRINTATIEINLKTVEDVRLRKAICCAFDRMAVLNSPSAYAGFGDPMYNIGYPGTWLHNDDVRFTYDPEKAQEILDKAGWTDTDGDGIREMDGKDIDLLFPTRSGLGWPEATAMIQQMLKNVGIDSHIETSPRLTFYDNVRVGKYDIAWWLDNEAPAPPIATRGIDHREHWFVGQKEIPTIQTLLEEAETTINKERRAKLYKEIQEILYEKAIFCPGLWTKQVHVASPKLHNFQVSSTARAINSWRWWLEGD